MTVITDLETTTTGVNSRPIINTNFDNLNGDKLEKSGGIMTGSLSFSGTTHNGLVVLNLTTAQRDALAAPANGIIIYNTTDNEFEFYENGVWTSLSTGTTDASTSVKGVVEIATTAEIDAGTGTGGTGAVIATSPDNLATSIYGTQLPSSGEKDALVGTSGTPGSSNKYVTADDVTEAKTASKIPRRDSNSDILVATTPTAGDAATSKTYVEALNRTRKLLVDTTATTLVNSITETTVATVSVPANSLSTNNAIRGRLAITELDMFQGHALIVKIKYGGTTMITQTVTEASGVDLTDMKGYIDFNIYADGGTSAQYADAKLFATDDRAHNSGLADVAYNFSTGSATEDSTGALNLVVTVDWDNANAGNKITVKGAIFELIT